MRQADLAQLLAAEEVLRPHITDPSISVTALALKVVTAYLDASPARKKCKAKSTEIALTDDPVVISLPTIDSALSYCVRQSHYTQFQALYPAVDVAQELRNMAGWLLNNRRNAKTVSGMPRFINSWLAKTQNRSRPNGNGKPSNNDSWLAGAAELATELRSQR